MRSELFEQTLKQHRDSLTNELQGLGKDKQAALAVWDIELNEANYEHYFNAAWDYRQTEIDAQQAKVRELGHKLSVALGDIEVANKNLRDRLVAYDLVRHEADDLQKRVDAALQKIKGAARWIDEDAIDDPDFIKGGVLSALRRLEQALKGEG